MAEFPGHLALVLITFFLIIAVSGAIMYLSTWLICTRSERRLFHGRLDTEAVVSPRSNPATSTNYCAQRVIANTIAPVDIADRRSIRVHQSRSVLPIYEVELQSYTREMARRVQRDATRVYSADRTRTEARQAAATERVNNLRSQLSGDAHGSEIVVTVTRESLRTPPPIYMADMSPPFYQNTDAGRARHGSIQHGEWVGFRRSC